MSTNIPPSETKKAKLHPFLRALLGLLLLLPACGLCSSDLLLLTLNNLLGSFRSVSLQGSGDFVGMQNYERLFSDPRFSSSFGFTVSLIFIHLLAATTLPPLLAFAVNALSKKLHLAVRLLFTLPLAFFGPALVMFGPAYMRGLWDVESPESTYLLIDGIASLAVACGLGLIVYSMVLRGQKESEQSSKLLSAPLIVTWLVAQLGTAAFAIQSFTSLSGLLPSWSGIPLGYFLFQTVRNAQGGLTFAISFFIFILVALLGIAAALLIIISKIHLKHESKPDNETTNPPVQRKFNSMSWIVIIIGGIAAISVTLVPLFMSMPKALTSLGDFSALDFSTLLRIWANSILAPLFAILFIQLPIAYLGGLGISIIRPFGKWSQWLLLLFSPWLFVTTVPFAFAAFQNLRKVELVDSPLALTPPILLSVPMLFILVLFFHGQETKWQEAHAEGMSAMSAFFKHLIVPSLPLALLMAAFSLLAATQDLLMPLLVGLSPEQLTATTAILKFSASSNPASSSLVIALFGLPLFLIFFVIFAVLQVFYLDHFVLIRKPVETKQDKVKLELTNS